MFYFDEDHMKNGFDAPLASDSEEEQQVGEAFHQQNQTECGNEARKPASKYVQSSKEWQRAKNSDFTTSSTGSCGGSRCSLEGTTGSSHRECVSEHTIDGEFDGLSDGKSESEEQPAELVPLGVRSYSMSGCNGRYRKKIRSHFTDFYKLMDDHLGSGAYASVKTGISIATNKEFAIKLIDKRTAGHTRSRVIHEVETFNLCKNHPNIVQLHEWFEDQDRFYLVFEKMNGGPLLDHIQRKKFFTEQEASKVTKDIATALKFLHDRGIAHRDVKPENILCSDIDHVSPVKLCDLDLASKASPPASPRLTNVNSEPDLASPVGSAEFMAPEVVGAFVGDALKYDKRCDMWSLGVIVYIMICGYPPFYGVCWRENCGWDQGLACSDCQENLFKRIQRGQFDFPAPEWENVSEEAKDLICHMLVKNVRQRFTADEVLKHPWVKNGAPETKLQTPGNLFRNDSTRVVHQMQEHFNVMNRIVAARLSARIDQSEHDSDEPANERPVSRRSPECKISEDTTVEKNLMGSVDLKQLGNVITTKAKTKFRHRSSNLNRNVPKTKEKGPGRVCIDEAADDRPISRQSQECKISEDSTAKKNPMKSVDSKQLHSVITTKPEGRFRQQSSISNRNVPKTREKGPGTESNVRKPVIDKTPVQGRIVQRTVPSDLSINGFNISGGQNPLHMSKKSLPSAVRYADRLSFLQTPHGISSLSSHEWGQNINMNRMALYPFMSTPPINLRQPALQEMFHIVPPSNMVTAAFRRTPYRMANGKKNLHGMDEQKLQCNGMAKAQQQLSVGEQAHRPMVSVRSAVNLSASSFGDNHQREQLETCQGAMVKQDSKTDLRQCQARETKVNV